jgi:hypothetical protein
MRKHAFIKDNIVISVESITEDEYIQRISNYQTIIDIEDNSQLVENGWLLSGNHLVSPTPLVYDTEYAKKIILRPAVKFAFEIKEEFTVELKIDQEYEKEENLGDKKDIFEDNIRPYYIVLAKALYPKASLYFPVVRYEPAF